MGSYANATCHECGIRRPLYLMKRKVVRRKTGNSGWGLSFNPQRKKSARIYAPRTRYSNSEKWFCKDNSAHGKLNYYVELEKKKAQEKIERQRTRKLNEEKKEKQRILDEKLKIEKEKIGIQRKIELQNKKIEEQEKKISEIKKNQLTLINNLITNFIKQHYKNRISNNDVKIDKKTIVEIENHYINYYFLDYKKIKSKKLILRYHLIPSILLPFILIENILFPLTVLNLLISPFLFIYSFFYKRNFFKLIDNYKTKLNVIISKLINDLIKNNDKIDLSKYLDDNKLFIIDKISNELSIDKSFKNTENENETKVNKPKIQTSLNAGDLNKKSFTDIIFREDFFEICTATFALRVALLDNDLHKDEEKFLEKYFKNFKKEEYEFIRSLQKEFNDEVLCNIILKRFGDNIILYEDLINNLFGVSESDGNTSNIEINYIKKIGTLLNLTNDQILSIQNDNLRNSKLVGHEISDHHYEESSFDDIDEIIDNN